MYRPQHRRILEDIVDSQAAMNVGGRVLPAVHEDRDRPRIAGGIAVGLSDVRACPPIQIGLLTGGEDRHYAFGLTMALVSEGVGLDFIGSDQLDSPELHGNPRVNFLNLRGDVRREASLAARVSRVLAYYARLLHYAAIAEPKTFHILWNNKFQYIDRTLLMMYYRLLGKRIVLTAHNVNARRRDSSDTLLNRVTLKIQYRLAHSIFVHTEKMKRELIDEFHVHDTAVTIIPYGINNAIPDTELTPAEAKRRLGINPREKTLLCFGNIAPYKGLEYLVAAFHEMARQDPDYRLMIAGRPKSGSERYLRDIQQTIAEGPAPERVIQKIAYIPDEDTEVYFKAADVLILPYTEIFQSGVLFLGYSFGLPAIVTDVGSLGDDVLAGRTGLVCRPRDSADLMKAIEAYFASDLFADLNRRRQDIRDFVKTRHSWDDVARITRNVYARLLGAGR